MITLEFLITSLIVVLIPDPWAGGGADGLQRHRSWPPRQRVHGHWLHGWHLAAFAGDGSGADGCAAHQRGGFSGA